MNKRKKSKSIKRTISKARPVLPVEMKQMSSSQRQNTLMDLYYVKFRKMKSAQKRRAFLRALGKVATGDSHEYVRWMSANLLNMAAMEFPELEKSAATQLKKAISKERTFVRSFMMAHLIRIEGINDINFIRRQFGEKNVRDKKNWLWIIVKNTKSRESLKLSFVREALEREKNPEIKRDLKIMDTVLSEGAEGIKKIIESNREDIGEICRIIYFVTNFSDKVKINLLTRAFKKKRSGVIAELLGFLNAKVPW